MFQSIICYLKLSQTCAHFGIELEFENDNVDVCHEHVLHSSIIESGSSAKVSLWYINGAEFNTSCLSWCTPDGVMPTTSQQDKTALDEILASMVSHPKAYKHSNS